MNICLTKYCLFKSFRVLYLLLKLLFVVMKESQGVQMMYQLLQSIESKRQYVFSPEDYENFHTCVEIYETHLAKNVSKRRTLDIHSKRQIKTQLRKGLQKHTTVEEKLQCLTHILHILGNYKAILEDQEKFMY